MHCPKLGTRWREEQTLAKGDVEIERPKKKDRKVVVGFATSVRERTGSSSDRLWKEVEFCGTFRDKFTTDFVGMFQANFTGK